MMYTVSVTAEITTGMRHAMIVTFALLFLAAAMQIVDTKSSASCFPVTPIRFLVKNFLIHFFLKFEGYNNLCTAHGALAASF